MDEYQRNFSKVVEELDTFYIMKCQPPRLLKYKKKYNIIDKDLYIVLAETKHDFLIYSNEEKHEVINTLVIPKYKVPLLFDLEKGFEDYCLCESLTFLKAYHSGCNDVFQEISRLVDNVESDSDSLSEN